jgi:hypothetical protein
MQLEQWPEITTLDMQDLMAHELGARLNATPFISVPPESQHYWHILRLEWLQERAELIGVGRHRYAITENFLDRMGDVNIIYPYLEQTYGVTSDWEIKGAPTLEKVWAAWWPQWSKDRALAEQCWWLERTYPADCIGWTIFCMCRDAHMQDKAQRWEPGYDISDWTEFQALMVINRDVPAKPPGPSPIPDPDPLPEPEPLPDAPSWLLCLMLAVCGILFAIVIYGVLKPRLAAQVSGDHEMEQAFAQLVSWIIQTANVDGLPFAIALGTLLTGLTKMALVNVPQKYRPSGQLTALVWQVIIWAFWMTTRQAGFEEQFMVFGTNFTPIVIMVVNSLLGTKFQSVIYDRYLATKVSIAGYQRSPNRNIPPAK